MSTATENKVKGKFNEVAGKVKQSVGEATNNDRIANEGAAQQVKGHAEQAWGSVKEAANASTTSKTQREAEHENTAHDIREKITTTAQNVKNHIQNSAADYRAKHEK
jgi:uncharacterized protein YjbJ (UPF0337 family)